MSSPNFAIIHLGPDPEAVSRTQRSIAREISAGRDVVVVCEDRRLMREERLMLACSVVARGGGESHVGQGRVAIVNAGCAGREKELPIRVSRAVRYFTSLDSAVDWLQPSVCCPLASTTLYLSLPAC